MGYSDGYRDGSDAGYSRGYRTGETAGKAVGDAEGYARGDTEGYARGYLEGEAAGKAVGKAAGYLEGEAAGKAVGYSDGVAVGKADGDAVGYTRGYSAGETAGYTRGEAAGKAACSGSGSGGGGQQMPDGTLRDAQGRTIYPVTVTFTEYDETYNEIVSQAVVYSYSKNIFVTNNAYSHGKSKSFVNLGNSIVGGGVEYTYKSAQPDSVTALINTLN